MLREEFRPGLERVWERVLNGSGASRMRSANLGRFLGLGLEDRVPDAKTVWLYREGLAQAGLVESLFSQFDGFLSRQGYIGQKSRCPLVDRADVPDRIAVLLDELGLLNRAILLLERGEDAEAAG